MNCEEAISYIHSLQKFGIQPGLQKISALCDALGNPQKSLKVIHVAGTNGKGSTSTMISNMLIASGYDVGLYISPYVSDFRERIQLNGKMIEKSALAKAVEKVKNAIDNVLIPKGIQPTEFEALTATAFVFYAESNCDFVVLEVGLGGRFDATNIIENPLVSVIVSISLDHTAILGDTIEKIAFEKCGIIKKNAVTVSYPLQSDDAINVIKEKCKEMNNNLIIPDSSLISLESEDFDGTTAKYGDICFKLSLAGKHMIYNACTAIEAVKALSAYNLDISNEAIAKGIEASTMPARLELINKNPIILLDGGHNEGCGRAVEEYIDKFLRNRRIIMVSSMMADKDYESYLLSVASKASVFIATKADVPRALSSDELMKTAEKYCKECYSVSDPQKAIEAGISFCDENSIFFVCGSFYLAEEVRDYLKNI